MLEGSSENDDEGRELHTRRNSHKKSEKKGVQNSPQKKTTFLLHRHSDPKFKAMLVKGDRGRNEKQKDINISEAFSERTFLCLALSTRNLV